MRRRCLSPLGGNNEAEPQPMQGTTEAAGAFWPNSPGATIQGRSSNHTGRQFGGAPTRTGHQFGEFGLAGTKAAMSLKVFVDILLLSSASKLYIYRR